VKQKREGRGEEGRGEKGRQEPVKSVKPRACKVATPPLARQTT